VSHAVVEALGWSLIHSLWECAAAGLLFALLHLVLRSANSRYIAGCLTMLLMLAAPSATFVKLLDSRQTPVHATVTTPTSTPATVTITVAPVSTSAATQRMPDYLPIAVWLWISGVIALSSWETASWVVAQRLKRRNRRCLPQTWESRFDALRQSMGVRKAVRLYESALAQTPAVIGWIRPVILVPAGALINLSAPELEAVLAHELAHVRRFDYVANLLQTVIETLLFFHPAVWWVGKSIRAEREHCCDDMAVRACGDRLVYARALTSLEEMRCSTPQFAVAATSGSLSSRIQRLLGRHQPLRRSLPLWLVAMLPLFISVTLFGYTHSTRTSQQTAAPAPAFSAIPAMPQPTPSPAPAAPTTVPDMSGAPAEPGPAWAPPAPNPPITGAPQEPGPLDPPAVLATPASTPQALPLPAAPPAVTPPPTPAPRAVVASNHEGYLGGLADAGYTSISVDEIIDLKQNGVSPSYIKAMLQAGFGVLTPKQLISLHTNGIPPEYAHAVKTAGLRDLKVEDVVRLHQYGVRADLLEALAAAGYADVTVNQAIDAQNNGLSAGALRSLREQGFKNLTFEQVMKLKRAGVI